MYKYYTSIVMILQANLSKFTIFVKNAEFYVNIIMLTGATKAGGVFIIFDDTAISCINVKSAPQNVPTVSKVTI